MKTSNRRRAIRVCLQDYGEVKKLRYLDHGVETAGLNVVDVDGSLLCAGSCEWCDALKDRCASRGGTVHADPAKFPAVPREDPLDELSAVLWFLASLTCDHEPGCAIKQGDGSLCDCDKPLPDGDPWYVRARNALRIVGDLKAEQTKRAVLSCNGCGTQLRRGETMVCADCARPLEEQIQYCYPDPPKVVPHEYVATEPYRGCSVCGVGPGAACHNSAEVKRFHEEKHCHAGGGPHDDSCAEGATPFPEEPRGRVLQLKPLAGHPGPNGNGTVYEVALPDRVVRLIVLRAERGSVSPAEFEELRKGYQKLFEGTAGLVLICPGDELTLLELPR